MPAEIATNSSKQASYRPPQEILDVFWILSDGTDEQRIGGSIKLAKLINSVKNEERVQILNYCQDRLVKGLSSGRKFARVGFSVALTQLLRQFTELQTDVLVSTIKHKLKVRGFERKSKAEVGAIYLGRAFAFSAVIESGRLSQLSGDALSALVDELLIMAQKKSYLKAVCHKTVEDLISQISTDAFGEHVWPKLRDNMKAGWESCTLDKISLLMACRNKFPDVVNKKFLKKHWGFPVFNEENDDKVLRAILDTAQKTDILLEKILPMLMENERDVTSIWKGLGAKLMQQLPDKKADVMAQRQLLGIKMASKLLDSVSDAQQILDLVLSPRLAKATFHSITKKNDPLAAAADSLCSVLCKKLKEGSADILEVVERVWKMEAALSESEGQKTGRVDLVHSQNFTYIIDMLSRSEAEQYVNILMGIVKGVDKWQVLSNKAAKKHKQVDWCLRQLQHISCSQQHTTAQIQRTVLSLFARLAFFHVNKKSKNIEHCESCVNLEEENHTRKMCESFFYKSLDSLSTLNTGQQSRSDQLTSYMDLLSHLSKYIQTLLKAENVKPVKSWPEEVNGEWEKLTEFVTKINSKTSSKTQDRDSAFLLLLLFLGFQMLTDFKTASELIQDVYVCYDKATKVKKIKDTQDGTEPHWVEVLTEVLLNLLSLQSHLGRVITASVFKSLSVYITPGAINLVTEVLTPKSVRGDDAGGVLVDADDDDQEEDNEDTSDEEDVSDGESEEDKDDEEEIMEEDDEEEEEEDINGEVDETFRQSVKEALGEAADNGADEDEEELPDLSDSQMFELDDMLAEVFRQRQKKGGKKAREEKKKETANFRVRVLDLVETVIKGERCGDFLIDLLKPLLLLMLKANPTENQALCDRSRALFNLLKSKSKGLKDTIHLAEDQQNLFSELLELARTVTDSTHLQHVAMACYMVMNTECSASKEQDSSECLRLLKTSLENVISKKHSKPHLSFFSTLIELDPVKFQQFSTMLLKSLNDESTKIHSQMICCSLLVSLAKKVENIKESDVKAMKKWMTEAAGLMTKLILAIDKEDIKVMFTKDILTLAAALQARTDILPQNPIDDSVRQHLLVVKSKFNTDLRRLANKVISSVDKSSSESNKRTKKKKRKESDTAEDEAPPAKRSKKAA